MSEGINRKKELAKGLKYAAGCAAVVGIRGFGLAHLIQGKYEFSDFLIDTVSLITLMGVNHLIYYYFQRLLPRIGIRGKKSAFTARLTFVVLFFFPFLLVSIQLHPQKIAGLQRPDAFGVGYDHVSFETDGLILRGWMLNPAGEKPPLLLLHGLNANKGNFLPIAVELAKRGFPVLVFDLEAHGESDGRQTTFGFREKRDVIAGARFLQEKYPARQPVALGYSLGGAALLQAAAAERTMFARIVVDATYANVQDVVREKLLGPLMPILWPSLRFWTYVWTGLDPEQFENLTAISRIDPSHVRLIHGTADQMISISNGRALRDASGDSLELWEIDGADHLGTVSASSYFERIEEFLVRG